MCKTFDLQELTTDLPEQFVRELIEPVQASRARIFDRLSRTVELQNSTLGEILKIHPQSFVRDPTGRQRLKELIAALTSVLISMTRYNENIVRFDRS